MINAVGNRMTREINRQSQLADQVLQTQIQVSTGQRIQRRSDDPTGFARAASLDQDKSAAAGWARNVDQAASRVAQADGVMASSSDLMARVGELVLAAGGTVNAADRNTIANELTALADELASLAATSAPNGEPLFLPGIAGREARFDSNIVFAPLPGRDSAMAIGGRSMAVIAADAATAVRSGNPALITTAATEANSAIAHLADQRAQLGLSGARLERIGETLAARDIDLATERSALMDTDLSDAIARLNAQTLTLEAAQAAFARINRQTLFDLLR
jgi:flagellar hook-associated protein 3 FlgL